MADTEMNDNMNIDSHPKLEQLAAFNDAPDTPQHVGLRRHLATCVDCRQRFGQLNILTGNLRAAPPSSEATVLPDELLQAIDSGRLDDAQRRDLNDDPAALKAALHYAVHAPAMQEHLEQSSATMTSTQTTKQKPGLLQRLLDWRPPAWGAIPVSAAAAFALALVVLPLAMSPSSESGLIVASYADRPALALQDPAADLPGLGFFHAAEARDIPFDGVQLSYSRTTGLSANWSPVEGAKNYHLRLSQVNAEGQQLVAEADIDQPQAHFSQLRPAPGRYQWLLTGQVADGSRFRASGGFVVNGS